MEPRENLCKNVFESDSSIVITLDNIWEYLMSIFCANRISVWCPEGVGTGACALLTAVPQRSLVQRHRSLRCSREGALENAGGRRATWQLQRSAGNFELWWHFLWCYRWVGMRGFWWRCIVSTEAGREQPRPPDFSRGMAGGGLKKRVCAMLVYREVLGQEKAHQSIGHPTTSLTIWIW
jgi:hypothetical protein